MEASGIPVKFALPFAADATPGTYLTTPIPTATQTGPNVGRASLTVGFPPVTFVDPATGGTWPDGRDVNGAFNMTSSAEQWNQAGAPWPYDSAFQSSIGGYPNGAIVASATTQGRYWICTVDNNTSNPDSGGGGWVQWGSYVVVQVVGAGTDNVTVPPYCNQVWLEVWGGGGGASGGTGASGAGGGYSAGWFSVSPGQVLALSNGVGGSGSNNFLASAGGTTSVSIGMTTLLQATGGGPGGNGPNPGGIGSGGQINIPGAPGTDIDIGGSFQAGQTGMAPGGAAPRGGAGGVLNFAGSGIQPVGPGGGGAANFNVATGQNGAVGGIVVAFRIGS